MQRRPGTSVVLRRANPADAQAIGAVLTAAARSASPYTGVPAQRLTSAAVDWDALIDHHTPPDTVMAAVQDADVVGFSAVDSSGAELVLLAVDPRHTGRGIGGALIRNAHDTLRAAGHRQAFLYVEEHNAHAISVYTGAGYRPDGAVRESYPPGVVVRELRLIKTL